MQVVPTSTQEIPLAEAPKEAGAPPRFMQPVTSIDANEGEKVTFETVVTGTPAPQVKWFREREEITTSLDFQVYPLFFSQHLAMASP